MGEFLVPAEVSKIFGVHPRTVRRWADQGKLEASYTAGGHCRIPRSALGDLVEDEPEPPEPPPIPTAFEIIESWA